MTFPNHDGSGGPARLPNTMSTAQELELLIDITRRACDRIGELLPIRRQEIAALTKSGLKQAAPGVLLFKGGPDA